MRQRPEAPHQGDRGQPWSAEPGGAYGLLAARALMRRCALLRASGLYLVQYLLRQ